MSVKFVIDSASDINVNEADNMGVIVVPLKTYFGEEEYLDGVTLDSQGFYEKMYEYGQKPRTAAIAPYDFDLVFKEELQKGNDIVCIDLSKQVSACYQSACIAKQDLEADNIYIVDSKNASVAERLLVELGIKLGKEGKTAKEISEILNDKTNNLKLIIILESLDYLTSGGRISKDAAPSNLNGVKPIVALEEGKVVMKGKARGTKNAIELLNQLIEEAGGIDFDLPYSLGYSGLSDKAIRKYREDYKHLFNTNNAEDIPYYQMGCTIGTHLGPNCIGVSFFSKNKNN